ncbi:peptidoglycan DD-metalloendopeptidase family protein [Paenibacillus larvae]|uniref:Cell wall endopeptidase, family M23/M37 n=2 Tax=Paenibacillus larvae TaxID=1464 RepID=A0A2L1U7C9_9BACL|nr:peptidoglycan DD-metalloendopeptidase family protein [Paenibacillus larvae]AVF28837.1 cell wall endopeptidase, family M23/M37 [Paenibacillus larvae subsp. larvae]MCY9500299.1 peptidoglycan DD-metalloendopeptidase family protein [Paenibacillus larvae]MCY9746953.1 peptidoglycan DD-metalloendopeptidase family protein [Paenibacillus larvae]MDR5608735.1 peptidoglycan DD-metalloendopeptidase family protein [Paenibacillus larvae]
MRGTVKRVLTKKVIAYVGIPGFIIFFLFIMIVASVAMILADGSSKNQGPGGIGSCGQLVNVNDRVLGYRETVENELIKQGVSTEFTTCFLAQMMQESGGSPPDVFQASESKYGVIGAIQSAEESIEHAVKRWVEIRQQMENLEVPFSVETLWQTYNFGSGYLNWLVQTSQVHSIDTAFEYSSMWYDKLKDQGIYKCHFPEQKNQACYGDMLYPEHIKRYLIQNQNVDPDMKGDFQFPFAGGISFVVTSDYGHRWGKLHAGIDLVAYRGAPVSSIGDGKVVAANLSESYGNMVTIQHPNGLFTRYAHMDSITVSEGQEVKKGQQIGVQGNTGNSTGTHLHFEVRRGNDFGQGTSFDPRDLLPFPPSQSKN